MEMNGRRHLIVDVNTKEILFEGSHDESAAQIERMAQINYGRPLALYAPVRVVEMLSDTRVKTIWAAVHKYPASVTEESGQTPISDPDKKILLKSYRRARGKK